MLYVVITKDKNGEVMERNTYKSKKRAEVQAKLYTRMYPKLKTEIKEEE